MAIRKWLWPKLETTENADRDLLFVARWFYVCAFAVLVVAGWSDLGGEDVFIHFIMAASFACLAYLLQSKRSRIAALIFGCNAASSPLEFGAEIQDCHGPIFVVLVVAVLAIKGFFSVRAIRAAFVFHRLAETRVVWPRVWALCGIATGYSVAFFVVVFMVHLGVYVGDFFPETDTTSAAAMVYMAGLLIILMMAFTRVLPGAKKIGAVATIDGKATPPPPQFSSIQYGKQPTRQHIGIRGYLAGHWRGELCLARSFWINFATPMALFSAVIWGFYNIEFFESFRALATVFVVAIGALCCVLVWSHIGSWRAAAAYSSRAAAKFWPLVVRAVVLSSAAGILAFGLPPFVTMVEIASGLDFYNKFTVSRTGPKEVMIRGLIGSNLPEELAPLLRTTVIEQQEVEWIRLESPGGRVGAAFEIAEMIGDLGLKVKVWDECSSACFISLLGSDVRVISRKAKVGLHAYSGVAGFKFGIKGDMDRDREKLISRGVSAEFLDKAFATPPDDMWYPSFEELIEAGVVTHIMENGEIRPVHPD